jgi:ankyrin repeat protein
LSEESEDRNTALHLAAFRGSVELVTYILQVRPQSWLRAHTLSYSNTDTGIPLEATYLDIALSDA